MESGLRPAVADQDAFLQRLRRERDVLGSARQRTLVDVAIRHVAAEIVEFDIERLMGTMVAEPRHELRGLPDAEDLIGRDAVREYYLRTFTEAGPDRAAMEIDNVSVGDNAIVKVGTVVYSGPGLAVRAPSLAAQLDLSKPCLLRKRLCHVMSFQGDLIEAESHWFDGAFTAADISYADGSLAAPATPGPATAAISSVHEVRDRLDIIEVCTRMHWIVDHKDWDALDTVLSERVSFPTFAEQEAPDFDPALHLRARDDIKAAYPALLGGLTTQHLIAGHQVELAGDRAVCRAHSINVHLAGGAVLTHGNEYRFDLERTAVGWRICGRRTWIRWTIGDESIHDAPGKMEASVGGVPRSAG
jgi:hypothetical protein